VGWTGADQWDALLALEDGLEARVNFTSVRQAEGGVEAAVEAEVDAEGEIEAELDEEEANQGLETADEETAVIEEEIEAVDAEEEAQENTINVETMARGNFIIRQNFRRSHLADRTMADGSCTADAWDPATMVRHSQPRFVCGGASGFLRGLSVTTGWVVR
jgi:hypothetical protein